jgi:hypothetical protein
MRIVYKTKYLFFRAIYVIKSILSRPHKKPCTPPTQNNRSRHRCSLNQHAQNTIQELISIAWKTPKYPHNTAFTLPASQLYQQRADQAIKTMLEHARSVAPGLQVPYAQPNIIFTDTPSKTAGFFRVDEAGYVSITINSRFMLDRKSTYAVLSHELCHYILENSGIRRKNTLENERLTDICMFVLGYDELFLNGYKTKLAQSGYRANHKLGYFNDKEYLAIQEQVNNQRGATTPYSEIEAYRSKLLLRLSGNEVVLERYIKEYGKKHPNLTEKARLECILYDLNNR